MDEEINREENNKNSYLIPGAVIFAGIIIAGAIIYSLKVSNNQPSATNSGQEPLTASMLPEVSSEDFVLGDSAAGVTLIEYADFQCPFCGRFAKDTEPVVREKYVKTGKIKFVYRDFAFLGPESEWAANAARCAGDQGKFWEYHDYLYSHQNGENRGAFNKDNLKKFGRELGLNDSRFSVCVDNDTYLPIVKKQTLGGRDSGVQGTPTSFINGKSYVGALPAATISDAIEAVLK